MALIFALSSLPGSAVPGRFATPGHFVLYAVLASLYFAALDPALARPAAAASAIALASAYGVTDELHQAFVSGRRSDPVDWAVDTAGALAAVVVIRLVARRAASRSPIEPPAQP